MRACENGCLNVVIQLVNYDASNIDTTNEVN